MTDDGGRSPLGALILAVGRLAADEETAAAIARMLGIEVAPAPRTRPVPDRRPAVSEEVPPPEPPRVTEDRPPRSEPEGAPTAGHAPSGAGELRVVLRSGPVTRPARLPPALGEARPFRAARLPFEPLLRTLGTRAIVGAAITAPRPGGALDVARIVERIARRRPLAPLPWRCEAAVPGGVLVLVDRGPGMAPFGPDAEDLAARIGSVAGRDRTRVARVYGSPRLRVAGRPAPLVLPPRGGAVVALTDLGIAPAEERPPRVVEDWLAFASELRARGCRLIAFVPYPPARWPRRLAEAMTLLPWDRTTDVATVIRALRRAGGSAWTR